MKPLLILDGDDTLWETERLYDEARQAARALVESYGLDGALWERTERRFDVERVSSLGFSPQRFPGSCQLAYQAIAGPAQRDDRSLHVYQVASSPFERAAQLYPDASEFVDNVRKLGATLVLLTKGERKVQWLRVQQSGLAHNFDSVMIVPQKTVDEFAAIRQLYGHARSAVSIGNSWRSDIEPALDAGCTAIWIERHVWEHERSDGTIADQLPSSVHVAGSLTEALSLIDEEF